MEHRGVVVKVLESGALLRGDDGSRVFLPRSEILGGFPQVGTRVLYDVELTARTPVAVGARRLEPSARSERGA